MLLEAGLESTSAQLSRHGIWKDSLWPFGPSPGHVAPVNCRSTAGFLSLFSLVIGSEQAILHMPAPGLSCSRIPLQANMYAAEPRCKHMTSTPHRTPAPTLPPVLFSEGHFDVFELP